MLSLLNICLPFPSSRTPIHIFATQFFETLSLPNHNSPNPNQDHDSTMQDLIPITLTIVVDDDLEPDATTDCSGGTTTQHTMKQKKKGPKRIAMERKSREKLQVIVTTVISQN